MTITDLVRETRESLTPAPRAEAGEPGRTAPAWWRLRQRVRTARARVRDAVAPLD